MDSLKELEETWRHILPMPPLIGRPTYVKCMLDTEFNGIPIRDILQLHSEGKLMLLHDDQTPPSSYWSHGVEIPIAPEVHGRYYEHVWMKVKGLALSEPEEDQSEQD